ncbi:MAG: hypothetical protein RR316_05235, partial [Clostridia bacterium]
MKKELVVLSTTAILGYGFPMGSFEEGMKYNPDVIAADAGSTDPGPYYLGAGYSFTDRSAVKRDLSIMIQAGVKHHIPVIIGTCGGSGAMSHLLEVVEIVKEISKEKVSAVVLGCTHYPFIKESLVNIINNNVSIIDGSQGTVRQL